MPGGPMLGTKASMCAWCAGKSHVAACATDVTGAGCKDLVLRAHARGERVRGIHTAARRNPSPAILWSEGGRLERTCSGVDPFAGHIRMTQSAWHLKLPPAAANTLAPERIRILRSHTLASWRTRMLIDRTLASGRTRMLIDRTLASGRKRTLTARRACGTFVTAD
jgi:hypothetical protein